MLDSNILTIVSTSSLTMLRHTFPLVQLMTWTRGPGGYPHIAAHITKNPLPHLTAGPPIVSLSWGFPYTKLCPWSHSSLNVSLVEHPPYRFCRNRVTQMSIEFCSHFCCGSFFVVWPKSFLTLARPCQLLVSTAHYSFFACDILSYFVSAVVTLHSKFWLS